MKEGENGTKCRFMVLHLRRVIGGPMWINTELNCNGPGVSGDADLNKTQTHSDTKGTHTQLDRKEIEVDNLSHRISTEHRWDNTLDLNY